MNPLGRAILSQAIAQRDPTRTVTLRRQYAADIRRHFGALKAEIEMVIGNGLLGPDGFTDRDDVAAFVAWLRNAVARLVLGVDGGPPDRWQLPYTRSAYLRGINAADRSLAGSVANPLPVEVFGIFTYQAELDALYRQAYDDLANIGAALIEQVEARLVEAATAGLSNAELLALITDRVNKIGITRGVTLAATAVVGTVAEATLSRLVSYGITQVGPVVEFTTAGNPCPICAGLRDRDVSGLGPGIYLIAEARGLIPVHPRCRCGWQPVRITANQTREIPPRWLAGRALAAIHH